MTNIGIDEVLRRLSIKFDKFFYDREFVGSVSEDLERIIRNENKCCLLVFPSFSPNYLRVARYQAKLCDLAVIELRSGGSKSIGVCHKKYLLTTDPGVSKKREEPREQCSRQMAEPTPNTTIRKKRPPIQLYVPPAQRKSRLGAILANNKDPIKNENRLKINSRRVNVVEPLLDKCEIKNIAIKKDMEANNIKLNVDNNRTKAICYCSEDIDYFYQNLFPYFSHKCNNCVKFFLFKDFFPNAKLLIFSIKRLKYSFHWIRSKKGNANIVIDDTNVENRRILEKGNLLKDIWKTSKLGLLLSFALDFTETRSTDELLQFQNTYCLSGKRFIFYLPDYMYNFYLSVPDFKIVHELKPEEYLHCYRNVEDNSYLQNFNFEKCFILPQTISKDIDNLLADKKSPQEHLQKEKSDNCDIKSNENCANLDVSSGERVVSPEKKMVAKVIDKVIVLEERIEPPTIDSKSISPPPITVKSKQNEHEQEKEIMRKAKQNINRKTRPIIKYIDDDNDTLNIGKGDNVNNWEDLFNDDGELQDDIFTEVVHKVGTDVTILKATEDYLSFGAKQIEELEHMVELYDFPSTLETNDIISSFSEIKSDSMYVKWVDDTHAILVLGSSLQAQKALTLSNQLIKVRPMSAASSLALEKANQFDLKPAMKRPQTNLQTARRLITSHLGTKSKVSREQSAKEREDLRVAKELKKKTKQNELDAWEGNLRSSIN